MKKNQKSARPVRLLAFFMVVVVLVGLFPAAAMAAGLADLTVAINDEFEDGAGRTLLWLDKDDYTPESWEAYTDAIDAAIEVEGLAEPTQQEIDDAIAALAVAKDNLKPAEADEGPFFVMVVSSNSKYGTVTGSGVFEEGEEATVTAKPKTGYRFIRWADEENATVSELAVYTFSVTQDTILIAEFAKTGVPSITAAGTAYNQITIRWGAVNGATEYEVFRATSKSGKYTKIGATAETQFVNTVTSGKTYYYKVRIKCVAGAIVTYGALSGYKSAKALPRAPVNAAALTTGKGIQISWDASDGATKYEIYRATKANGKYKKVKEVSGTTFTNTGLTPKTKYYYKVRVLRVGSTKVTSAFSAAVSALAPPYTPAKPKAASFPYNVRLSWPKAKGASGYEVWYSDAADGTFAKLDEYYGQDKKNAYCWHVVEELGRTFYYKVRSYYYSSALGANVYSNFSSVVSGSPRDYYNPSFKSTMPSGSKTGVKTISFKIKNNGSVPMYFYNGAILFDDESGYYDRLLVFTSSSLRKKGYQEIKPGKTATVSLKVYSGGASRYNKYSTILFYIKYDSLFYFCESSNFYGDDWELDDEDDLGDLSFSAQKGMLMERADKLKIR